MLHWRLFMILVTLGTLMTICAYGFKMSSSTDLPTLQQDHTLISSTSSCNLGLRLQSFFMLLFIPIFLTVSTSLRFLFTLSYPLVWPQLCFCLWLQPWCGASGEFRCFSPLWEHSQPSPWWPWPLARTTGCMLGPLSATALPTPLRMTHTTRTRRILELSPTPASGGFAAWKVSERLCLCVGAKDWVMYGCMWGGNDAWRRSPPVQFA